MLPVYILCHADCEPAGYFCDYLDARNIPYKKINSLKLDVSTINLDAVSGLVFMGGPYSLMDNCEWMSKEISLIQGARKKNIPMMGVCLGAQLISKALGSEVSKAHFMETGWHQIRFDSSVLAGSASINLDKTFEVFEWHEDTFDIPDGATAIFKGENFENQGYILGNILAMQFHLEMTSDMVHEWLGRYKHCLPEPCRYVQSPLQITENLDQRLDQLHQVADQIYGWWFSMLD